MISVVTSGSGTGPAVAAGGKLIQSLANSSETSDPRKSETPALQIPDSSPQIISSELQKPDSLPPFDPNWTPPIVSFDPYRVPQESTYIADSLPPIIESNPEGSSLKGILQDTSSNLVHVALDVIHDVGSVFPQLLEEIKDVGGRWIPEDSNNDEITPLQNYENLFANAHEQIDQLFATEKADLFTPEAKAIPNKFDIGILPPPGMFTSITANSSKLAEAGKVLDRGGLTKAGRGLMKHGYREGSAFPKPTGTPAQVNEHGQKILESILNDPERIIYERPHPDFGKVVEVAIPGKWGARFTVDGEMIGFLEP